jgi:hypothetical protein
MRNQADVGCSLRSGTPPSGQRMAPIRKTNWSTRRPTLGCGPHTHPAPLLAVESSHSGRPSRAAAVKMRE